MAHFFLCSWPLLFPFKFLDCSMQKTVVFIQIPVYGIQHELLIHLLGRTIVESAEVHIFLDVTKVSLWLDGSNLTVQDASFT